jgi:hypothetical protein
MKKNLCLLIIGVCFILQLNGQVNLKIGFESAYISSEQNRMAVEAFNDLYAETLVQGKEMPNLNFANGLSIGLGYKWDYARISANWHGASRRRQAFGEVPVTEASFEREVRYRMSGFNLKYEFLYERYSLGLAAGRDVLNMTTLIGSTANDRTILNEPTYNLKISLGMRLITSERVAVCIEPFYTYLFNDINHSAEYLYYEQANVPSNSSDRPHYFGFQLTFYNGIQ